MSSSEKLLTISTLKRDPTRDITRPEKKGKRALGHFLVLYPQVKSPKDRARKQQYLPKKGRIKATQTVDMTSAVLRRMKNQKLVAKVTGTNSSILLASGFSSSAYVNKH